MSVDPEHLQSLRHLRGIDKSHGAGKHGDKPGCALVRVDYPRMALSFRAKHLLDPVTLEFRLAHTVNRLENDLALARGGGPHQQGHAQARDPELALAHQKLAYLGKAEIVHRDIRTYHDGH